MIRRLVASLILLGMLAAPAAANWCGTPGKNGTATVSGTVNTYFPGTTDEAVGSTAIGIGAATGAGGGIAIGDLLLIIQMQDATITTTNNANYGDGAGGVTGGGYSGVGQSGRFEFVRATNAVSAAGGTVNIQGATGAGTVYQYLFNAAANSGYKQSFQVVRVPQYDEATITGTVTAAPWNGTSGGIVAIDVARRLTFSGGTISVNGSGFRGGGGLSMGGGSGANTDYRTLGTNGANAAKGEGIVGTPRYVNNAGTLLDTGVEGIPSGSFARGAPGNAGGGGTDGNPAGNDENSGGGGGGNGGAGGKGGHAWCNGAPIGCDQSGGFGAGAYADASVSRLVMGGGGGAGTNNNATGTPGNGFASSGAAGGGIVMIRAGEIAGTGTINADGADGNTTLLNDGAGGGGAGGSVLIASVRTVAGTTISVNARGGDGGSNSFAAAHGPGGGGGGGYVASSLTVSSNVTGGAAGTTPNGGAFGANYGAVAGNGGNGISIIGANIPGASGGGECTPTIAKAFDTPLITLGATTRMNITITNNNPTRALNTLAFTDTYPAGMVNTAAPAAGKSCATAGTVTAAANGGTLAVTAATINAASSCIYSANTTATTNGDKTNTIAAGALTASYGTPVQNLAPASAIMTVAPPLTIVKSSTAYTDPLNNATNPKLIPGGYVAYTILVANPGAYTVTNNSIIVVDATPANLQLVVATLPGGSGPVLFTNGTPASGLTYTFTSLASTTDDVEFSNNNQASWTYTPVVNADGVDPAVTHIRIRPKGSMAPGSNFTLLFGYRVV